MKVRMNVSISGTHDGQPWPPKGDVVDLPSDHAAALCAAGHAEPVADTGVEKAVDERPVQKRRGRPAGSKNKPAATDAQPTPETGDAAGEPNGD